MTGLASKKVRGGLIAVVAALPLIANCGALPGGVPGVPGVPGAGKCPDLKDPAAIMSFDFAGNFKLSADVGAKLKGATAAAVDINALAAQIDGDLKTACGGIAKDLGATGEFKDGQAACEAAIKAIGDVKAKIGGSAKITLTMKPPVCRASMDAMADCAGKCDAKLSGGKAKVECEPGKLSGECGAQCEGSCDMSASAKCDGECSGSCDAEFKGSCSGTCNGKCDGKDSKGSCAGECHGKCEGGTAKGECKGKCGGSCKLKAAAKCEGTCNGKCSVEMKAPKCTGEVKPPEMSADCKAHCDASVSAKAECTPAQVGIAMSGKGDAEAFGKLKATLEKNLPLVLKVAIGMGDKVGKLAANAKAVVEGGVSTMTEVAGKGGGAAALNGAALTACLGETFKGAASAAGSIQANVKVSASVSASASGSAGGSAGSK
jgi:hypothetical protein